MRKTKLLEIVDDLPEDVDVEALFDKLFVLQKIEVAEKQFAEGKEIPHEEIEREFGVCQE